MSMHQPDSAPMHPALRAAELVAPTLTEAGRGGEERRQLPGPCVALLRDHGLFDLFLPQSLGGYECDMVTGLQVIEAVSAADAASGWCLLKVASSNQLAAYLPPAAAAAIFGPGRRIVAGSLNPKGRAVRDGENWRLSGRWDWGTATGFADFVLAGAVLFEPGADAPIAGPRGPRSLVFIVPRDQVALHDTWHTYGMRGTGSGDFSIDEVVVPEAHALDMMALRPHETGPLFTRVPYMAQVMLPHGALALGIAQAALDALVQLAGAKTPLGSKSLLKDKYWVQDAVGRASAEIAASRAWLHAAVRAAWDEKPFSPADGLALSLASTHATHRAITAVDLMTQAAGGSAVFEASPLQRHFRDLHVAASHFLVNVEKYAGAGRVVFGDAASPLMG